MKEFWKEPKFWGVVASVVLTVASAIVAQAVPEPWTEIVQMGIIGVGTIVGSALGVSVVVGRTEKRLNARFSEIEARISKLR